MKYHAIAVCALVRNDQNQILLINHFQRSWDIPGGYVEPGEDLITAIKRELEEETGVMISKACLRIIYTNCQVEKSTSGQEIPPKTIFAFECYSETKKLATSRENDKTMWVKELEALELISNQLQYDRLNDLLTSFPGVRYVVYSKNPYQRLKYLGWEN